MPHSGLVVNCLACSCTVRTPLPQASWAPGRTLGGWRCPPASHLQGRSAENGFSNFHERYTQGGPPQNKFIYKKLCIYSYTFKFQSPSKYPPFDAIHLWRHFLHCTKQFLNSSILMPFSVTAVFGVTSFTLAKCFPLRTFFTLGDKQ